MYRGSFEFTERDFDIIADPMGVSQEVVLIF